MCDLIKSSDAEDIIPYLPTVWTVAFKVLDDIKESVRKAATSLAKTLNKVFFLSCYIYNFYSLIGYRAGRTGGLRTGGLN